MHKSRVAQAATRECKFEQLNHLPYSPDLAPSDSYLFRNLKSHLGGTRFRNDDELKAATEAWFEDQIDDFYFKGIDCLKEKWAKCRGELPTICSTGQHHSKSVFLIARRVD